MAWLAFEEFDSDQVEEIRQYLVLKNPEKKEFSRAYYEEYRKSRPWWKVESETIKAVKLPFIPIIYPPLSRYQTINCREVSRRNLRFL